MGSQAEHQSVCKQLRVICACTDCVLKAISTRHHVLDSSIGEVCIHSCITNSFSARQSENHGQSWNQYEHRRSMETRRHTFLLSRIAFLSKVRRHSFRIAGLVRASFPEEAGYAPRMAPVIVQGDAPKMAATSSVLVRLGGSWVASASAEGRL